MPICTCSPPPRTAVLLPPHSLDCSYWLPKSPQPAVVDILAVVHWDFWGEEEKLEELLLPGEKALMGHGFKYLIATKLMTHTYKPTQYKVQNDEN